MRRREAASDVVWVWGDVVLAVMFEPSHEMPRPPCLALFLLQTSSPTIYLLHSTGQAVAAAELNGFFRCWCWYGGGMVRVSLTSPHYNLTHGYFVLVAPVNQSRSHWVTLFPSYRFSFGVKVKNMSSKGNAPNRRVAAIQAKKKRKQPKKSKQGEGQNSNKERERNRETRQTQPQPPVHHEIDKNRSFEEVSCYDFI